MIAASRQLREVAQGLRMSSSEWPDLSRLAALTRDQRHDVRPVLLRAHADLFVAAPSRDRATIEAFEALAMGFLPIVDDATAAAVARKLAPIDDTPTAVIDALVRRGGEARAAVLTHRKHLEPPPAAAHEDHSSANREEPDDGIGIAVARNVRASLDSARLGELVERGRERPQLAMALLGRRDLGAGDEAVLYLHADDARRAQIRARLESLVALSARGASLGRAAPDQVGALLGFARALDTAAFDAQLARMLRLDPAPAWRFQVEPRRELLALALVAAGVAPEDCIQVFLTVHPAISRSVTTVFHLAQIARTVSRPVAVHLIEAILDVDIEAKHQGRHVPAADPSQAPARNRANSAMRPSVSQIRAKVLARRAG
jgi:hypothetical protein